ncbi:MAG: type II secretion system protein [Gammaproteobacteria bacterium]|nr:type II secretion system protein [Gammaproteobacteria bacterium]
MRTRSRHRQPAGRPIRLIGMTLVETLVTFVILGFLTTLILQAVGFFAARYEGVQRVHRLAALESLQQNWFATSVQGFVPYGVHARRFQGRPTYFEGITLEPLNAQAGTPVTVRWSIAEDAVRYAESLAPMVPGIEWTVRGSHTSVRPDSRSESDTPDFGLNRDIEMRSRSANAPAAGQGDLVFHYADSFANWWDHWPPRPDARPVPGTTPQSGQAELQSVDDLIDALAQTVTVAPTDPLSDPANDWTPRLIRLFSAAEGTIWLARVEPSARPLLTDVDLE